MMDAKRSKYIQSLKDKKNRDAEGLFLAEGTKIINELCKHNYSIHKIYATENWLTQNPIHLTCIEVVQPSYLKQWSSLTTPSEVIAVLPKFSPKPININTEWLLCLDGIQDPGNLGTIIRTAAWFGVKQIICSLDTVDNYNPKVIQSAMGSIFSMNIQYENLVSFLRNYPMPIYAATLQGKNIFEIHDVFPKGALLMGNEGNGIRPELFSLSVQQVSIPSKNKAIESLNVAIATGILLAQMTK